MRYSYNHVGLRTGVVVVVVAATSACVDDPLCGDKPTKWTLYAGQRRPLLLPPPPRPHCQHTHTHTHRRIFIFPTSFQLRFAVGGSLESQRTGSRGSVPLLLSLPSSTPPPFPSLPLEEGPLNTGRWSGGTLQHQFYSMLFMTSCLRKPVRVCLAVISLTGFSPWNI